MVFIVIAYVERDEVQGTVIIKRLLRRIRGKMLLEPARAERMQASDRKPEGREKINKRIWAEAG